MECITTCRRCSVSRLTSEGITKRKVQVYKPQNMCDPLSQFFMPLNKPTTSEQFEHASRPSVWGTHLEMKAAATLLQVPIYFCMQFTQSDPFHWSVFRPISPDKISLRKIILLTLKCIIINVIMMQ